MHWYYLKVILKRHHFYETKHPPKPFYLFRFNKVQFEIASTDDVGVFAVSARFMGVSMEKVELVFQVNIYIRKFKNIMYLKKVCSQKKKKVQHFFVRLEY